MPKKGNIPWNKGLTKDTDERVKNNCKGASKRMKKYMSNKNNRKKISETLKRKYKSGELKIYSHWTGKTMSKESNLKRSKTMKGKQVKRNRTIHGKSKPELELYKILKNKVLNHHKITNKKGIKTSDGYRYPDILCEELKLIIEYDGSYYHKNINNDLKRDKLLNNKGYKVIHYIDLVPSIEQLKHNIQICMLTKENYYFTENKK